MKLILIFLLLFLLSSSALACSCVKMSVEQQYQQALNVFMGTVLELKNVNIKSERDSFLDYTLAKVKIYKQIKGTYPTVTTVRDQFPSVGMCSLFLTVNSEYVFFVGKDGDVGMCSGTFEFEPTPLIRKKILNELIELREQVTKKHNK